jgi:hypothetical protein
MIVAVLGVIATLYVMTTTRDIQTHFIVMLIAFAAVVLMSLQGGIDFSPVSFFTGMNAIGMLVIGASKEVVGILLVITIIFSMIEIIKEKILILFIVYAIISATIMAVTTIIGSLIGQAPWGLVVGNGAFMIVWLFITAKTRPLFHSIDETKKITQMGLVKRAAETFFEGRRKGDFGKKAQKSFDNITKLTKMFPEDAFTCINWIVVATLFFWVA